MNISELKHDNSRIKVEIDNCNTKLNSTKEVKDKLEDYDHKIYRINKQLKELNDDIKLLDRT